MITCVKCRSSKIIKKGYRRNKSGIVQKLYCISCKSWFVDRGFFKGSRYKPEIVRYVLQLYENDFSLKQIQQKTYQAHKVRVSFGTISKWSRKYSFLFALFRR